MALALFSNPETHQHDPCNKFCCCNSHFTLHVCFFIPFCLDMFLLVPCEPSILHSLSHGLQEKDENGLQSLDFKECCVQEAVTLIITVHKTIMNNNRIIHLLFLFHICCSQLTAFMLFAADLFYKDLAFVCMYLIHETYIEKKQWF